jgi:hypothetical protein
VQLLSGMHTSINIHISEHFHPPSKKRRDWAPNAVLLPASCYGLFKKEKSSMLCTQKASKASAASLICLCACACVLRGHEERAQAACGCTHACTHACPI